jgi:hypothetical protein
MVISRLMFCHDTKDNIAGVTSEPAAPDYRCPCGDARELSASVRFYYEATTPIAGDRAKITTADGTWLVPRIFVAVHGLKAAELPMLAGRYGFERAT